MSIVRRFAEANRRICRSLERTFPRFFRKEYSKRELIRRIEADLERTVGSVLEVGGGGIDRPMLTKSSRYSYEGLDIEEKQACHEIYDHFIVQSIEKRLDRSFQMIISNTVLDHIPDNRAAINTIFQALVPGGTTHHYSPSKNHPYSLCLRLVGPRLQKILISHLRPAAVEITGYPAFFDHCTPAGMRGLLSAAGFCDIDIKPYYRANDYFAFFVPAFPVITALENLCRRLGWSFFASGFVISARKPDPDQSDVLQT